MIKDELINDELMEILNAVLAVASKLSPTDRTTALARAKEVLKEFGYTIRKGRLIVIPRGDRGPEAN